MKTKKINYMWSINQKVISSSKYSKNKEGVIWKLSEEAVHVRFGIHENAQFQKFYYNPKNHMQTNILELRPFLQ